MAALPLLRDVQPLRKSTLGKRPDLAVVQNRRRWPAVLAGFLWALVFAGLLGAAVFHTQLAERQLQIDRLERSVAAQRELFDELRYERARLRSPVRLATAAGEIGMRRGSNGEFVEVSAQQLARQLAAAGVVNVGAVQIIVSSEPLEQFRDVKSVTDGQP
ncbi:MAG: hypothetical protein IZT58_07180 [Actinobacteria bacterium]|nr:hypothetical protein [Actinomycetota bacterium]